MVAMVVAMPVMEGMEVGRREGGMGAGCMEMQPTL